VLAGALPSWGSAIPRRSRFAPPAHAPPVGNRRLTGETGSKPVGWERDGRVQPAEQNAGSPHPQLGARPPTTIPNPLFPRIRCSACRPVPSPAPLRPSALSVFKPSAIRVNRTTGHRLVGKRRLPGETGWKAASARRNRLEGGGAGSGCRARPGVARRASHGSAGRLVGKRVLTRATHAGGGFWRRVGVRSGTTADSRKEGIGDRRGRADRVQIGDGVE